MAKAVVEIREIGATGENQNSQNLRFLVLCGPFWSQLGDIFMLELREKKQSKTHKYEW